MAFNPNTNEYVDSIDLSFDEPLNEATICTDYNNGLTIDIFPRDTYLIGYLNDPYFKIYNHSNMRAAKNVARISILDARYIHHSDPNGKKDFKLSSHQKSVMIKMLKSPVIVNKEHYDTGWEAICKYLQDTADKYSINVDYSNIIPINKMPDYMKL